MGAVPGVRLPRDLNLEENSEHLKWTHLEKVQNCINLSRWVTFQAHTEQGKMEQGWDERYRSLREEKKTSKRETLEDRRPILKKLCAVFLRSFRGQHGKKIVCARGVPGVNGTLGKDNRHFYPIQTGLGTAPPR